MKRVPLSRLLIATALLSLGGLTACGEEDPGTDRPRPEGDDTGEEEEVQPETECLDELDNDDDGLVDCDDDDCAAVFECTWPSLVDHRTRVDVSPGKADCGWLGVHDVDPCTTEFTSTLTEITEGEVCEQCSATFRGDFTYTQDSCAELTGNTGPASGEFGLVFVSEDRWVLWGRNETSGQWEEGVDLMKQDGLYQFTTTSRLQEEVEGCDYSADMTVKLTFSPAD